MRRWVSAAVTVAGDGDGLREAFAGDPARWLPSPARPLDDEHWSVTLRWGPIARAVACRVLPTRQTGPVLWRHVVWDPQRYPDSPASSALPRLEAEAGLVLGRRGGAELTFTGSYVPPFGVLGVAADAAAMHRVAVDSVDGFLTDIAVLLTAASSRVTSQSTRT